MVHDGMVDDVLHNFTRDGSKRDWSVIGWSVSVVLLMNGNNVSSKPVLWEFCIFKGFLEYQL